MHECVNPAHPDKVADRIAGAVVDLAYGIEDSPKVAAEVLIGHGRCHVIIESSCRIGRGPVEAAIRRIAGGGIEADVAEWPQDASLAANQAGRLRCGDNGIFRGTPVTAEQRELSRIARLLYARFPTDGKLVLDRGRLTVCQSCATEGDIRRALLSFGWGGPALINPLGSWTGGTGVDSGAVNRKLGSDMADSVTGGGLHGKDLSKADVSANIYAWLKAQRTGRTVELSCSIGDAVLDGRPYSEIVSAARSFVEGLGGFEKLAEWGLIRP